MRAVFGVSLIAGMTALILWVIGRALGETAGRFDPERRFGKRGRGVIAALVAFGMGGLSAAYAGWPLWLATLAAAFAAFLGAWFASIDRGETG